MILPNEIAYNTEISKSNLCDYYDAYILVRGDINVVAAPATQVAFTNCAPFTKCIKNIDETTIDDAEHLDLVMPIYNLIEYSSNYSETTGSLWFYSQLKLILIIILQILIISSLSSIRLNIMKNRNSC